MTRPTTTATIEPPRWPTAECKGEGCGQTIIWARTNQGRGMPVDVDPAEDGNVLLRTWPGHDQPEAQVVSKPERFTVPLYRSHFVTCPAAAKFRNHRPRVARRAL